MWKFYWWILIFLLINSIMDTTSSSIEFSELSESNGVRLELIHVHSLRKLNQLERLKDLLELDGVRHRVMLRKLRTKYGSNGRRGVKEVAFKMPLRAGADYGAGQYFVSVKFGTPAQQFLVIADTGSDLTWTNCRRRCGGRVGSRRNSNRRRVFCADHSSSFKTFPCSSRVCKVDLAELFSLTRCPTPVTPCAYDYSYADGSTALGIFANETITVQLVSGRKMKLHNVLVGCSERSQGSTVHLAYGVLGLGLRNHSFAVKAAEKFEGKFSYCLVDHLSHINVSNYLVFGDHKREVAVGEMQYTKLLLGVLDSFYAVNVNGISLGGVMLRIPNEVWNVHNGTGGTILDSGTSLTFLTRPAYQPVMAGLMMSLSKFKKLELAGLDHCFDSTGFDESLVPRLAFHFADGARFAPPVKSYVIDAAEGVKCLGIVSTDSPGTNVIGNIVQQNHIWEFDILKSRLGFSASTCT